MKPILFLIAAICFPQVVAATSIIAVWTAERVVIAADGKLTSSAGTSSKVCKIRKEGNFWYASAGLYEYAKMDFSISAIVHKAYETSQFRDRLLTFATLDLTPAVGERLMTARETVDEILKKNANLNFSDVVMIAKEKDGLKVVHHQTDISRNAQTFSPNGIRIVSVSSDIRDLPTEHPPKMQMLTAPRKHAVNEYIARFPELIESGNPVLIARKFIQLEIERYTDEVGDPIAILSIEKDGTAEWKEHGACKDAQ
jgi:hypothetical protein